MPNLRISDPLYERLLRRSVSFDDTAEDVINRLLEEADRNTPAERGDNDPPSHRPAPAAPGSILPVSAYWIPILEILDEAGGSAPANDVIDALEPRMGVDFQRSDRMLLKNGEVRWRNRARFARLRMKERGFLSDRSYRGVWEITDAGRSFLFENRADRNRARPKQS